MAVSDLIAYPMKVRFVNAQTYSNLEENSEIHVLGKDKLLP